MILDGLFKTESVIDYLQKKYPNEGWKAIREGFGWRYQNKLGDNAWWCAALAPRYDGDDDTFSKQFHIYRKDGQAERIFFF